MPSFAYKSLVLLYDNDDGSQSIRTQKLKIKPNTNETYVPLTSLIIERQIGFNSQIENTIVNVRHLNLEIDKQEFKLIIPYNSSNSSKMKACIKEILEFSQVTAGRYIGESIKDGDTANNNI